MTLLVFSIVLLGAAFHAGWNAILKDGSDKALSTVLIVGSGAAIALTVLPWLGLPDPASWPYALASGLIQIVYYWLMAQAYHHADMGQVYPLMRGGAPLLVAAAGSGLMGEHLSPLAWLGIVTICLGIAVLALGTHARNRGVAFALTNSAAIACYTLVDGAGVRLSKAPFAYTLLVTFLAGLPVASWALVARRQAMRAYLGRNWHFGLIAGVGTIASYSLALWAMTKAPIPVVAALRETSILFGVLLAALVLKEHIGVRKVASAGVIAMGAMLLRLA